jgi:hypothetical protein
MFLFVEGNEATLNSNSAWFVGPPNIWAIGKRPLSTFHWPPKVAQKTDRHFRVWDTWQSAQLSRRECWLLHSHFPGPVVSSHAIPTVHGIRIKSKRTEKRFRKNKRKQNLPLPHLWRDTVIIQTTLTSTSIANSFGCLFVPSGRFSLHFFFPFTFLEQSASS